MRLLYWDHFLFALIVGFWLGAGCMKRKLTGLPWRDVL